MSICVGTTLRELGGTQHESSVGRLGRLQDSARRIGPRNPILQVLTRQYKGHSPTPAAALAARRPLCDTALSSSCMRLRAIKRSSIAAQCISEQPNTAQVVCVAVTD